MKKEFLEDYRKHKLLARFHQGEFKGRVWDCSNMLLTEIKGNNLEELVIVLKNYVDNTVLEKANNRTSAPEVEEYVRALQNILKAKLPDSYLAMLKAHYHAPNRTITATQLAKAANISENWNYNSANLHYGSLGKRLNEEVPIQLLTRKNGKPIPTSAIATAGDLSLAEEHWQWIMRPEVAKAIEQLGLHN